MKKLVLRCLYFSLALLSFAENKISQDELIPVAKRIAESKPGEYNKPIVFRMPGMDNVRVAKINNTGMPKLEVYYPPNFAFQTPIAAVILVNSFNDAEFSASIGGGNAMRDLLWFISWAQVIATTGMAAVTYETFDKPIQSLLAVLGYLRNQECYLGIDYSRLGIWAASSHVYPAQFILNERTGGFGKILKCAAFYYSGNESMPPEGFPILFARPGRDNIPGNQEEFARFIAAAKKAGVDLTIADYPEGEHAFDLVNDTDRSRQIIAQTLKFFKEHLMEE